MNFSKQSHNSLNFKISSRNSKIPSRSKMRMQRNSRGKWKWLSLHLNRQWQLQVIHLQAPLLPRLKLRIRSLIIHRRTILMQHNRKIIQLSLKNRHWLCLLNKKFWMLLLKIIQKPFNKKLSQQKIRLPKHQLLKNRSQLRMKLRKPLLPRSQNHHRMIPRRLFLKSLNQLRMRPKKLLPKRVNQLKKKPRKLLPKNPSHQRIKLPLLKLIQENQRVLCHLQELSTTIHLFTNNWGSHSFQRIETAKMISWMLRRVKSRNEVKLFI